MARYEKIKLLLEDDFKKVQDASIILLGVGGVGGFCLDCLSRSGINDITIVDFDSFDQSNQNRQVWSELHHGEIKVDAMKQHYPHIKTINAKIDEEWVWKFDFDRYDIVLDAIDDTKAKLALAQKCHKKLISSFGSANRIDASQIKVGDIWKSYGDKLGAKIRYELRKRGFNKKYKVIFSSEEPLNKTNGSFMGVSASFGLFMCSESLKKIMNYKN